MTNLCEDLCDEVFYIIPKYKEAQVSSAYSDTYMGIKHENTEQMSAEYFHHRDTLALFITLST